MVWGGFCGCTKSDLMCVPDKATLDSVAYVTAVMEPHLVPLLHGYCEGCVWAVVAEDDALGHKLKGHNAKK